MDLVFPRGCHFQRSNPHFIAIAGDPTLQILFCLSPDIFHGTIPGTFYCDLTLARMFHEWPNATTDMAVLPGVLECRTLRRTVQVRLGPNTLWLPGGTPISIVSPQQFIKHPD